MRKINYDGRQKTEDQRSKIDGVVDVLGVPGVLNVPCVLNMNRLPVIGTRMTRM